MTSRDSRVISAKKHSVLVLFLGVVVVLGCAFAVYWLTYGRFIEKTDNAYVEADITQISAQLSARIDKVLVTDNQHVKAGTLLVILESDDYRHQLSKINNQIKALQVELSSLETLKSQQAAQIDMYKAEVAASSAELDRNQRNFKRISALQKKGFASEEQLTAIRASTRVAEATRKKAEAALRSQQLELSRLDDQQHHLEIQLQAAHNDRALAELNLSRTRIVAPIDGLVGDRSARVGRYVRPGENLLSIIPGDVWIQANFKETQVSRMKPGQKVDLAFDAYPDLSLEGVVDSLFPATGSQFSMLPPDNATGNFTKIIQRVPIKISLPNDCPEKSLIRPGLSVVVRVDTRG